MRFAAADAFLYGHAADVLRRLREAEAARRRREAEQANAHLTAIAFVKGKDGVWRLPADGR